MSHGEMSIVRIRNKVAVMAGTLILSAAATVAVAGGASAAGPASDNAARISARNDAAAATQGYHQIKNFKYSQCVDAPGAQLNVRLRLAGCSWLGTQKWGFVPTGATDTYFLVNQSSGFCMEVN